MKTYRDYMNLPKQNRVIALGNFDGVHKGHQPIIHKAIEMAHRYKAESAVFLFDPHPMERLYPTRAFSLLTTPLQRGLILSDMGVDSLILAEFTQAMMQMEPEKFIEEVLLNQCSAVGLSVGYDYTFGNRGLGTVTLLQDLAKQLHFSLSIQERVDYLGSAISSTRIKQAILDGNFSLVEALLGRPYQIHLKLEIQTNGDYLVELWPNAIAPLTGCHSVLIQGHPGEKKHIAKFWTRNGTHYYLSSSMQLLSGLWLSLYFLSDSTQTELDF